MFQAVACPARRWVVGGMCWVGLAACTSTPPSTTSPGPRADAPARVEPPPVVPAAVVLEAPAVAARFPDPALKDAPRASFSTHAELHALLQSLAREGSPAVRLIDLGKSQNGVPIEALVLARSGETTPAALQRSGRPTVLLVGQQQGDAVAASEALVVLAQELARGRLKPLLERINVVILPRANPDGVDVGHDHLLLKTPEAQAQARLVREFAPVVVVDAHEYPVGGAFRQKFGAVQRHDAWLQYAMVANMPPFVTRAAEEWFRQPLIASLKQQGLTSEWYHSTSTDLADTRLAMGSPQPDSARNAHGLKNTVSFVIASRGAGLAREHLKRRVHTQVTALTSVLNSAAARGADLLKLRQYVDAEISAQACQGQAVVDAAATPTEYSLQALDPLTGADKTLEVSWDSALVLRAVKLRTRPCGYWLAADQGDAVARLRSLGVRVDQVAAVGVMQAEVYAVGAAPKLEVSTTSTLIDVAVGSYYVPLSQPLANLVMAALEPDTAHSYAAHRIVSELHAQARVMALPGVKLTVMP